MDRPLRELLERKGMQVETVTVVTPVVLAAAQMTLHQVGSLVVMDHQQPVGMVTERDFVVRIVAAGRDPTTMMTRDIMTRDLVIVSPAMTIDESMVLITRHRCRHLLVADAGKVCGLVSVGDLTAWVVRDQKQTIHDLQHYITH